MTEQTDTATTPVKAPTPTEPVDPKAEPRQARQRIPWWATHPPTLIAAGLILVAVELIAYQGAGLLWWAIGNAVAVVLLLVAATVLRRKAVTRARAAAARGRTPAGAGRAPGASGGSRGGRSGMFGGGRRGGASGASGGGSSAGGRRGLLGRLTGRGKPSAAGASPAGSGTGSTPRRGLFGRRSGAARGAGSGASGGHTSGGAGSRGRGLFGRRGATSGGHGASGSGRSGGGLLGRLRSGGKSSGPSTGSGRGGSGSSGARSLWPFKRPSGSGAASPAKSSSAGSKPAGSGAASTAKGKPAASRWNPWNWKFSGATKPAPKAGDTKTADDATKPVPAKPAAIKSSDPQPDTKPPTRGPATAVVVPTPAARHAHAPEGRNPTMSIQHTDDASLQRWGRSLSHFAPALGELAKKNDATVADDEATAAAIAKIAQQGDSDQPASARLTAELEAIAAEQKKIAAEAAALAGRRRALASRAETLPAMYRQEHETDEDRMNAPRKSRQAEKRADVATAEQDT